MLGADMGPVGVDFFYHSRLVPAEDVGDGLRGSADAFRRELCPPSEAGAAEQDVDQVRRLLTLGDVA